MTSMIKCPNCGEEIELTQALTHQIEDQILEVERKKHQAELLEISAKSQAQAVEKTRGEFAKQLEDLKVAEQEERERNKKLSEQVGELMKELRESRRKQEDSKLEMEKRLAEEEGKIRDEAKKKALEEHDLKTREKDKVIADLQKSLADATRKAEQGSQQTQGEVLELEIEQVLHREFSLDQISEVKKGVRGADVTQIVIDKLGRSCGTILWESKNATWSGTWIPKLKDDARSAKAHIAVLVATDAPDNIKGFGYLDGVWVVRRDSIVALATALRYNLVSLHAERVSSTGRQEKSEILYSYVTSHEFRGRIEAIVEAFSGMQEEIEREKRWFNSKWSRQEKQIRAVVDNTQGMYGDMQGVVGRALPGLPSLELSE